MLKTLICHKTFIKKDCKVCFAWASKQCKEHSQRYTLGWMKVWPHIPTSFRSRTLSSIVTSRWCRIIHRFYSKFTICHYSFCMKYHDTSKPCSDWPICLEKLGKWVKGIVNVVANVFHLSPCLRLLSRPAAVLYFCNIICKIVVEHTAWVQVTSL